MVQLTEIDPFVSPQFYSITPEYKRRVTEIKQQLDEVTTMLKKLVSPSAEVPARSRTKKQKRKPRGPQPKGKPRGPVPNGMEWSKELGGWIPKRPDRPDLTVTAASDAPAAVV